MTAAEGFFQQIICYADKCEDLFVRILFLRFERTVGADEMVIVGIGEKFYHIARRVEDCNVMDLVTFSWASSSGTKINAANRKAWAVSAARTTYLRGAGIRA